MAKKKKKPSRAQYQAPTASTVTAPVEERPAPQVAAKKKSRSQVRTNPWNNESRGAMFLTVGWMFATLATVLSLFIWLGVWFYIGRGSDLPNAGLILTYVTFFALATGLITLVLGIVVNRIRNKPAPASIRRFAGIVGALPWAIYASMFLFSK
jgi:hypothetical protein